MLIFFYDFTFYCVICTVFLAGRLQPTVHKTHTHTHTLPDPQTHRRAEIQSGNSLDENKTFGIVSTKIVRRSPEHIIQTEACRDGDRRGGKEREHLCPLQTPQTDVRFQTPEKHSSCCYSKSQISGRAAKSRRSLI